MTDQPIINVRGIARYPWLNKPDTKFQPEGVYKVDLEIDAETAAPLLELCERLQAEAAKQYQAEKKGKKAKLADLPIQPQVDPETGEETGNYILRSKMKASGVTKKGKKWERVVPIFDAKGRPASIDIYGGSDIILAVQPRGWANPKGECSATFYLEGVQVIKPAKGSGGASASSLGFGAVAGGYEADDVDDDAADEADVEQEGGYDFE